MDIEYKIEQLREEYKLKPEKREIIIRQIRCLEIASGRQILHGSVKGTETLKKGGIKQTSLV